MSRRKALAALARPLGTQMACLEEGWLQ